MKHLKFSLLFIIFFQFNAKATLENNRVYNKEEIQTQHQNAAEAVITYLETEIYDKAVDLYCQIIRSSILYKAANTESHKKIVDELKNWSEQNIIPTEAELKAAKEEYFRSNDPRQYAIYTNLYRYLMEFLERFSHFGTIHPLIVGTRGQSLTQEEQDFIKEAINMSQALKKLDHKKIVEIIKSHLDFSERSESFQGDLNKLIKSNLETITPPTPSNNIEEIGLIIAHQ